MAVSKRLRFEVLRRDNHTCRYCGESAPGVKLVVDHVIPEALGGRDEPENLVAACVPCNGGKSSIAPDSATVANVSSDQLRWTRAMARARQLRQDLLEEREAYANYFLALWNEWKAGSGQYAKPMPLDENWRVSLDRFHEYDVDPEEIKSSVRVAMAANHVRPDQTFRYFCGCVWRTLRELQDAAADIFMADLADEVESEGW